MIRIKTVLPYVTRNIKVHIIVSKFDLFKVKSKPNKMMTPLKRFIQNALYYTNNVYNVNGLTPCGRSPCYCFLQENLKKDDKFYLRCYKSWVVFTTK